MILRNKICIFALITSLLLLALIFRHLAVGKISIIRPEHKFKPPPLEANPHDDTNRLQGEDPHPDIPEVEEIKTGHGHYDEKVGERVWTLQEWLKEWEETSNLKINNWEGKAIREVCEKTEWREDLIFECLKDPGNPRASFLTCLRYAIDAGAAVYLPSIDDNGPGGFGRGEQNCIFESIHFFDRLESGCPGLEFLPYPREGKHIRPEELGAITRTPPLHPDDLPHWSLFGSSPVTSVKNHVQKFVNASKGIITLVPFGPVYHYYPVCTDHVDFVDTFSQFMTRGGDFHHEMASKILWGLHRNYSIPLTPSTAAQPANSNDKNGFLAIRFETPSSWLHDDTESEPTKVPPYNVQRDYFHKRLRDSEHGSHGLKTAYISASEAIFTKFVKDSEREFGSEHGKITFLRGQDFLSDKKGEMWGGSQRPSEKEEFENMMARDLVDYLVMLRAQYFLGISESEISWDVATKRRVKSKTGSCGMRKSWTGWLWGSAMWDEWSDLMGHKKDGREDRMWP